MAAAAAAVLLMAAATLESCNRWVAALATALQQSVSKWQQWSIARALGTKQPVLVPRRAAKELERDTTRPSQQLTAQGEAQMSHRQCQERQRTAAAAGAAPADLQVAAQSPYCLALSSPCSPWQPQASLHKQRKHLTVGQGAHHSCHPSKIPTQGAAK